MGAWIEIDVLNDTLSPFVGRTPRWVRGLKLVKHNLQAPCPHGRTPRWVRGLKFFGDTNPSTCLKSHPTMGAWIEIQNYYNVCYVGGQGSHPTMGAWIEISHVRYE